MTENEIAKNILADRTCDTCINTKDWEIGQSGDGIKVCRKWLGEAIGWQWTPMLEENTCDCWRGDCG